MLCFFLTAYKGLSFDEVVSIILVAVHQHYARPTQGEGAGGFSPLASTPYHHFSVELKDKKVWKSSSHWQTFSELQESSEYSGYRIQF